MMGWEAVSILTFHQHRKCLPRSRSFLEGPIPVNGLHGFVKNHHVLGQGGRDAVCESLVAPEGNRGVPRSGPGPGGEALQQALQAQRRIRELQGALVPAQTERRAGRKGSHGRIAGAEFPRFSRRAGLGLPFWARPRHSALPVQGSPGGSREGPVRGQPPQHRAGLSALL